jgi:bifunctional non-homologous end joining protein LigD
MGKVGTGFNQAKLAEIFGMLEALETTKKPISDNIDEESLAVWIEPKYCCKIQFASMTPNNTYREPVFIEIFEHRLL